MNYSKKVSTIISIVFTAIIESLIIIIVIIVVVAVKRIKF